MLIKVALNGARPKSENAFIPHSVVEIENEVKALYSAGHKVFHIHCYDKSGNESLKPGDVNDLVSTVKNISSEIQIGISTGDWIEPDINKRIEHIKNWKFLPDFASVNMIEDDALPVSKALISRGIAIEAGLNEKAAAEKFVNYKITEHCFRILIEPEAEIFKEAIKTVDEIESVLDGNNVKVKRLLHGFNSVSWALLLEAKKRGYDGRIGMEDTLFLQNGKSVSGNLEIFTEVRNLLNI